MSLPWVKLHVPLLDNEDFKRFTPQAQHLYVTLLMLAGKQDTGDYSGRLETATGPLTIGEIRSHARYSPSVLSDSLKQLITAKFVLRDSKGTLSVARFREKASPLSSTNRTRAHRERTRNDGGTGGERVPDASGTRPEVEAEAEVYYASLRSAANERFATWPTDPKGLRDLAILFAARFANCPAEKNGGKNLQSYSSFLARMRERQHTIETVWDACEQAWIAGNEAPLFAGKIFGAQEFIGKPTHRSGGKADAADYMKAQGL